MAPLPASGDSVFMTIWERMLCGGDEYYPMSITEVGNPCTQENFIMSSLAVAMEVSWYKYRLTGLDRSCFQGNVMGNIVLVALLFNLLV